VYVTSQIAEPTTWTKDKIYVIEYGTMVNANLTIEPGTVIMFKADTWLDIGAYESVTFTANGTEDQPIKFTAYANSPAVGSWSGLRFSDNTLENSSISHCIIKFAGQNSDPALHIGKKLHLITTKLLMQKLMEYMHLKVLLHLITTQLTTLVLTPLKHTAMLYIQ